MTVKELRGLLAEAPDDMLVFVPIDSMVVGAFAFEEACSSISGVIEFGPADAPYGQEINPAENQGKAFLVAPHSFNPDNHEHDKAPPELN